MHADPALDTALAGGLDDAAPAGVAALAAEVARMLGPTTLAVIHYGSRAHGSSSAGSGPRPESADDFFVIVANYRETYRAVVAAGAGRYRPAVAAALNRVLPPNVIGIAGTSGARQRLAKCAVLSIEDLARACMPGARDHFVRARLFQQIRVAWSRDPASRDAIVRAIVMARAGTFHWVRPYLPASFDAAAYSRALLEVSFAAEIRPESAARVDVLFAAQAGTLVPMYDALLASLERGDVLTATAGVYTDRHPPGRFTRLRSATFFRWSKLRATVRWAKYIALYDGWLEYAVQKVARRSGTVITLTARERRWPLVFLWPKAFRYLRSRPQRHGANGRL